MAARREAVANADLGNAETYMVDSGSGSSDEDSLSNAALHQIAAEVCLRVLSRAFAIASYCHSGRKYWNSLAVSKTLLSLLHVRVVVTCLVPTAVIRLRKVAEYRAEGVSLLAVFFSKNS